MSAFVVSDVHIDALLTAAMLWGGKYDPRSAMTVHDAQVMGEMLQLVNQEAVNHRYNRDDAPEDYFFCRIQGKVDPVVVLKAIACYEYQACEHNGWESEKNVLVKDARKFLRDLKEQAIVHLVGYEQAPWAITDRQIFAVARRSA